MKKFNMIPVAFGMAFFVLFSSCSMMQKIRCNKEYAARKGMEDLEAGRISQPGALEGNSCEGAYSSHQFRNDYLYGFNQKKTEVCQPAYASRVGQDEGASGKNDKPGLVKFSVCSDMSSHKNILAAYNTAHAKAFCSTERAQKIGEADARDFKNSDFETPFTGCAGSLKTSYEKSYNQALAGLCTVSQAQQVAKQDAEAKKASNESRWTICTGKSSELSSAYAMVYNETSLRMAKEEAARIAREQELERQRRADQFRRTTAISKFMFRNRYHTASCDIPPDRGYVQVTVDNPYPQQVLLQGTWRVQYFNDNFQKITEDSMPEAVLLVPNTKKGFQKLTLPRDASYCRAELASGVTM